MAMLAVSYVAGVLPGGVMRRRQKVKSQGHGVNFGGHLATQLSSAVIYFSMFMFCAKFVAEILFIYYSII